ncbi:FtsX-like permease family protein [Streptosporangiaceae bacterium NEAU-GS5]|nr:FtsX-like permease family protein [Streptosporangiaceae bacterium NEAU-GS5]
MTIIWMRMELRRRWRSLLVLTLLLAFSTGTVLSAVAGARRGLSAVDRLLATTLPTTVVVLPNQPGFDWSKVRNLPEVEALTGFAVSGFGVDGLPWGANAFPAADDEVWRTIERPVVLEGRMPDMTKVDEVVVSSRFPGTYHKSVGDHVTLRLLAPDQLAAQGDDVVPRGRAIDATIVGVIRSPWFADHGNDGGFVAATSALYATYPGSIVSKEQGYVNALVRLKGGQSAVRAFRADMAKVTGRTDIDVWSMEQRFVAPWRKLTSFEGSSLLAFGLAALVAAIVLVGQSVARYAAATTADLRLLRPLGMTPRQVMAAASAAPLVAAVAGATAGVAAAIVVSDWTPLGSAALQEPAPGIDIDWLVLGTGWILVPILVLAACVTTAALTLAAAGRAGSARRSAVALAAARLGLPVPVQVGTRFALEPGRGRSSVPVRPALVGAVAGVLGVVGVFTFSAGLNDAAVNTQRWGQTHTLDAFLGLNGQEGPAGKILSVIARNPAVVSLNDARQAVGESGDTSVTFYTYQPVKGRHEAVLLDGRMAAGPGEVVLAPISAEQMGVSVGDSVRFTGREGRTGDFTVSGIGFLPTGPHNDYSDGGWITSADYDALFGDFFKFHTAQITLRPGSDTTAVMRQLQQATASLTGGDPLPLSRVTIPPMAGELVGVRVLPIVLGGFLVLLAVGAVGHALATAVRRRRHEVAVLRALGLTRLQARWTVITQATVLALAGLLAGVPLGLALGRTLWRLEADRTPLYYQPPWALWVILLIGPAAILIANALAAWPGHLAARLRIGHVLRAE